MPPDFHVTVRKHFNAHLPANQTTKPEQVTCGRKWLTRTPHSSLWLPLVRKHRRQIFFPSELRSLPDLSPQTIYRIPSFIMDTVQSLRPVGLSSWHLLFHPHSMYRVLRRVRKTLSFLTVWRRFELLTTPSPRTALIWRQVIFTSSYT
jgi:hypothetical protein